MFTALCKILTRVSTGFASILLVAGCILVMTASAQGQGPPGSCYPRDYLLTWLQENFGEVPVGYGVAEGKLVELLTSKDGISWTIIMTWPNGTSCMMTGGEAWRTLPQAPEDPGV